MTLGLDPVLVDTVFRSKFNEFFKENPEKLVSQLQPVLSSVKTVNIQKYIREHIKY